MEHHHTAKGGPPRHLHHIKDESFYVTEDDYIVEVGTRLHHLKADDSVLSPAAFPTPSSKKAQATPHDLRPRRKNGRVFNDQDKAGGRTIYVNDAEKMRAYNIELLDRHYIKLDKEYS